MNDLNKALAELRLVTPPNSPWEAGDIGVGSSPVDYHIATILNAAASGDLLPVQCCMCGKTGLSLKEGAGGPECQLDDGRWTCRRECWDMATGDLIPKADADLAVALMVEKAVGLVGALHEKLCVAGHPTLMLGQVTTQTFALGEQIRTIAPESALAKVQALRGERDRLDAVTNTLSEMWEGEQTARHSAEAELATLRAQNERLTGAATLALSDLEVAFKPHVAFVELIRLGTGAGLRLRAALTEGAAP